MSYKNNLRERLQGAETFDSEVLNTIHSEKWLQIWVPKQYGGMGCSFSEGLKILQEVSYIDGSLGWFVTLCSGANYFSRNLKPETAAKIFNKKHVCFGGSGMVGGTAEKIGDNYLINGSWKFATGAPFLTHFTLNAQIIENGMPLLDDNGIQKIKSFVLEPSQVSLIPSWKSFGLAATESHSFKVNNQIVSSERSFTYNEFYSTDSLDRLPFQIFADLTLLVNYLGMANHFIERSLEIRPDYNYDSSISYFKNKSQRVLEYALDIEKLLYENKSLDNALIYEIHNFGKQVVSSLVHHIITIYPQLGIQASVSTEFLNQIFRDFFTATQHANFRNDLLSFSEL